MGTAADLLDRVGAVIPEYIWRFVRQRSYRLEAEAHMTGSVGQLLEHLASLIGEQHVVGHHYRSTSA
jgi:hypothetical protein